MIYTPKDTPKYEYSKGDPMVLCFIRNNKTPTDTQCIEHLRLFMIAQEKEPLSPQRGFKVTAKWSAEKPSKQEEIVVGHGITTIFLCMQSIDLTAYP